MNTPTFSVVERQVFLHRSEGAYATPHHVEYDVIRNDGRKVRSGVRFFDTAKEIANRFTEMSSAQS